MHQGLLLGALYVGVRKCVRAEAVPRSRKQLALAVEVIEKSKDKDSQQYYGRLQGTLHNLAGTYKCDHRYLQAEQIYFRCLSILEQHLKADYLNSSSVLNSLEEIYEEQGKHDKAEVRRFEYSTDEASSLSSHFLTQKRPAYSIHLFTRS